ncbi:MAG: hypothetical protein MUP85_19070 [Candidatus Lokiarchaeota archaeon]|nr:hypothetical protein [Candidatus Lokiarchaeota archaeon]
MRFSRVFRWVVRIFILVLTLSLTGVSILGGMSAVAILGDPNNVNIPSGPINANLNISDVNTMYLQVPFNVTNVGFFALTNLRIEFSVRMIYDHVNLTGTGENITSSAIVFNKANPFPSIPIGQTYDGLFSASSGDGFLPINFPNATTEIDLYRTPHAIEFYADFIFSASYSLDLISFSVKLFNISVGYLL